MPRRREIQKRPVHPDPKYGDKLVTSFVNAMMRDGKKSTAERIMYDTIDLLNKREPSDEPLKVFKKALENCRPAVEVRSRRVGGSTRSDGSSTPPASAARRRWSTASPASCWTPTTTAATRCARKKTPTVWLMRTKRSRTIGGDSPNLAPKPTTCF